VLRQRHLFNRHVPQKPRQAGTRRSPFWILLQLKTTEVVVTTGAVRCAKLQSNRNHQRTISHPNIFTGCMPFASPSQQCQSTEGKKYHIPWTCSPRDLQPCRPPRQAPGYFGGGLPSLLSAFRRQNPVLKADIKLFSS